MPLFEVRGLSVGYGAPMLRDLSFSAEAGSVTGVLGRNGCGKTTLLRGIAGSVRRFAGEVLIGGTCCNRMSVRQQAACMSLLPQQTGVLPGILARDMIAMGRYPYGRLLGTLTPEDHARIDNSARTLRIVPLLDTDCAALSQGQRQLVLLARCLVQDTPVLLLDEPNAALDYDNTHAMFSAVRGMVQAGEKAALTVLHDPELALRYCDRVLLLSGGKICAALDTKTATPDSVEEALRLLYPDIRVRKDPFDGRFRCYEC